MRAFTAALLAVAASLVSAVTPVGDPTGNPISKPGLGELVPAGKPYTITWTPTTTGPVTILLLRGPSTNVVPIDTLVSGLDNTGTFTWTPSLSLDDDTTHYGLQLIVEATGQYQYSTQFGISNPGKASGSSASGTASGSASVTATANVTSSAPTTSTASTTQASYPTGNATTIMTTGSTAQTTLLTTSTAAATTSAVATKTATGAAAQVVVSSLGSLFLAVAAVFSFAF